MLVSQSHSLCFAAFQRLCAEAHGSQYEHIVQEEFDKYRLWAGNVGAAHSGKTFQLSLDYRLREASVYKDRVLKFLDILRGQIIKATEIFSGDRKPFEDFCSDSESDTSSQLLDSGSVNRSEDDSWEISSDSESERPLRDQNNPESKSKNDNNLTSGVKGPESSIQRINKPSEVDQLLDSIRLAVTCLYKLPLRKPAPVDRLADKSTEEVSCFQEFDARYIRDKFPDERLDEEVKNRLAKMVTRRRQLLVYRETHRSKLLTEVTAPKASPTTVSQKSADAKEKQQSKNEQQLTLPQEVQSQPESSHVTLKTKATTIKMDDMPALNLDDLYAPSVAVSESKTSIAASEVTRDIQIEVPPRPRNRDGLGLTRFQCKYCSLTPYINSDRAWKKHILADLQPYVCTFPDCALSDQLFADRDAWYSHETQNHRTEFFCNTEGHPSYAEKSKFDTHMMIDHNMSPQAVETLPDMFRKPLSSTGGTCNLCFQETKNLKSHISRHLQQVALFALPRADYTTDDEDLDGNSSASQNNVKGSARHEDSQKSSDSSDLSSLQPWNEVDAEGMEQRGPEVPAADQQPVRDEIPELDESSIVDWDGFTEKFSSAREGLSARPSIQPKFPGMELIQGYDQVACFLFTYPNPINKDWAEWLEDGFGKKKGWKTNTIVFPKTTSVYRSTVDFVRRYDNPKNLLVFYVDIERPHHLLAEPLLRSQFAWIEILLLTAVEADTFLMCNQMAPVYSKHRELGLMRENKDGRKFELLFLDFPGINISDLNIDNMIRPITAHRAGQLMSENAQYWHGNESYKTRDYKVFELVKSPEERDIFLYDIHKPHSDSTYFHRALNTTGPPRTRFEQLSHIIPLVDKLARRRYYRKLGWKKRQLEESYRLLESTAKLTREQLLTKYALRWRIIALRSRRFRVFGQLWQLWPSKEYDYEFDFDSDSEEGDSEYDSDSAEGGSDYGSDEEVSDSETQRTGMESVESV